MIDELRVFYSPGELVTIRHDLENKPVMLVKEKVERSFKDKDGNTNTTFVGIKVQWFDKNQVLREAIFSTKDLMHI